MLDKKDYEHWKCLSAGAFTVGLATKTPVDSDAVMRGLTRISRDHPELTESRFDKSKESYVLKNDEPDMARQALFKVEAFRRFEFAWGPSAAPGFQPRIQEMFETMQEGFDLHPINVEFIDLKFFVTSDWAGHHYRAIMEAFLQSSPLASLFSLDLILQDDLFLRGILDDKRVCIVGVTSDVDDKEVIRRSFKDDLLKAHVGIAQTRKIPVDGRIADIFVEHSQIAEAFIKERFIPYVADPLDRVLAKLSEEEVLAGAS